MPIKLTIEMGKQIKFWADVTKAVALSVTAVGGLAFSMFQAMRALGLVITVATVAPPVVPAPTFGPVKNATTVNTVAGAVAATMSTVNGLTIGR